MNEEQLKQAFADALKEFFPTLSNLQASGDVQQGSLQNPYKEFTYTIAAGESLSVFYVFKYFRVLSLTGSGLKIRFGGAADETDYTGSGIGFKLPSPVDRVFFRNSSGASITLTVALGVGDITDDRLNVSGTLNTIVYSGGNGSYGTTTVGTSNVLIFSSNANRKSVIIQNLSANDIYIGLNSSVTTSNGIKVTAGNSFTADYSGTVYAISNAAGSDVRYLEVVA